MLVLIRESIDYFIKLKNLKKNQSFEHLKDIFLVLTKKI